MMGAKKMVKSNWKKRPNQIDFNSNEGIIEVKN